MLAPQSDEEIRPVVEALQQRLDHLLDIRWNPRAHLVRTGSYSAIGQRVDAVYDGRWEVVRYSKASSLHDDREYVLITRVTEVVMDGRVPVMVADGAYAAIGWWLVEYMQLWDRAQSAAAREMERLWAEHDQLDELSDDRAAHQEGLEKVYREHGGGEYWMGGAHGTAAPETIAALWPEQTTTSQDGTTSITTSAE